MTLLEIKNISKKFTDNGRKVLQGITLDIEEGDFVAIMGPSGSGKSTFLKIISTLEEPTEGEIIFRGENISSKYVNNDKLSDFRRENLGFIFQDFNLISTLTVIENIMLPLTLNREDPTIAKKKAMRLMNNLDITKLKDDRIFNLSGGEAQRVAICRALIHEPQLILADEPTGSLDSKASNDVLNILSEVNQKHNMTTLMVTHDAYAASFCSKVIFVKDGIFYDQLIFGGGRREFYQNILGVLSKLGGQSYDLP